MSASKQEESEPKWEMGLHNNLGGLNKALEYIISNDLQALSETLISIQQRLRSPQQEPAALRVYLLSLRGSLSDVCNSLGTFSDFLRDLGRDLLVLRVGLRDKRPEGMDIVQASIRRQSLQMEAMMSQFGMETDVASPRAKTVEEKFKELEESEASAVRRAEDAERRAFESEGRLKRILDVF